MLYNNKIILMNINELIAIVKNKLEMEIVIQDLKIEDKSFLHKNHKGHQEGKFHLKLIIKSEELTKLNKIASTKKIYGILNIELKEYIHSIQIVLN
jgi:BolA protein